MKTALQYLKIIFCFGSLIALSTFESERLFIPISGFFSVPVSKSLSMAVLGIAILISIFGSRKMSIGANGIIFLLILSSYGSDLKSKYNKIIDTGSQRTRALVQKEKEPPKVPSVHGCRREKDPDYKWVYNDCIARFNRSVKRTEEQVRVIESENERIRTANAGIKDQTDWLEFQMSIFNGVVIACFFWIATLFFCRISKGAIEAIRELHKVKDKDKVIIQEVIHKQETIADKLKRLPDLEAIDLILEQGLFYCTDKRRNDRYAALKLYEHKGLTEKFETYYRRMKRMRESKKTIPKLKVVNGGKG